MRVFFHTLRKEDLIHLLDRAVDLIPRTRLAALVEDYVDLNSLRLESRAAGGLLGAIRAFDAASRQGDYFEDFNVNSKNYMNKSRGTQTWIADCSRLLDNCVTAAGKGRHAEALEGFELIFALLRRIDEGHDDIIFFADEGGSWQVGVYWDTVLAAWLKCLAQTATPEAFVEAAVTTIDEFSSHRRDKHLKEARRVASPEQRKALRARQRQGAER